MIKRGFIRCGYVNEKGKVTVFNKAERSGSDGRDEPDERKGKITCRMP